MEPKTNIRIHGNPRRLTWADVGGKPYVPVEAHTVTIVRACLTHAYTFAYRTLRRREILNTITKDALPMKGTNALTGALATRRRRPCRYPPTLDHAIPQHEWPKPVTEIGPGTVLVADPAGGPFVDAYSEVRLWCLWNSGRLTDHDLPPEDRSNDFSSSSQVGAANRQHRSEEPRTPTAGHQSSVHLTVPEDDFLDVFGFGGALD